MGKWEFFLLPKGMENHLFRDQPDMGLLCVKSLLADYKSLH